MKKIKQKTPKTKLRDSVLITFSITLMHTDLYNVSSYEYLKCVGVARQAYAPNSKTTFIKELEKRIPVLSREKENLVKEKNTPTMMHFVQIKGQLEE